MTVLKIKRNGEWEDVLDWDVEVKTQSKTVTPSASQQIVVPDAGYNALDKVTVQGDSDLVPGNIVKGKSIFGVVGTAETGGGGSDDGWIGDGNTHIWIHLGEGRTSPILGCCPNGTVTIDWGDGTKPSTLTGTSTSTVEWTSKHNYASAGDYRITLTVSGSMGFYSGGDSITRGCQLLWNSSSAGDSANRGYRNAIKKVEIGSAVNRIADHAFAHCYGLVSVHIPATVTSIGAGVFSNCFCLMDVNIPEQVTKIDDQFLNSCYSLASIKVAESVTTVDYGAFMSCYSLGKIRFDRKTPPTFGSQVFISVPFDCIISVPVGSLAAYKSATNCPNPSAYTYIEED